MVRIVAASSKVVVMAEKARELLRSVYQVPIDKIEVVAHGIPDVGEILVAARHPLADEPHVVVSDRIRHDELGSLAHLQPRQHELRGAGGAGPRRPRVGGNGSIGLLDCFRLGQPFLLVG